MRYAAGTGKSPKRQPCRNALECPEAVQEKERCFISSDHLGVDAGSVPTTLPRSSSACRLAARLTLPPHRAPGRPRSRPAPSTPTYWPVAAARSSHPLIGHDLVADKPGGSFGVGPGSPSVARRKILAPAVVGANAVLRHGILDPTRKARPRIHGKEMVPYYGDCPGRA